MKKIMEVIHTNNNETTTISKTDGGYFEISSNDIVIAVEKSEQDMYDYLMSEISNM